MNKIFFKACENGNMETIVGILAIDDSVNRLIGLRHATMNNRVDVVRLLQSDDSMSFMMACISGHTEIVRILIRCVSDPESGFRYACRHNHDTIIRIIIDHCGFTDEMNEGFLLACLAQNHHIVNILLDLGANIHYNNDRAYEYACISGSIDMIKILIARGLGPTFNGFREACRCDQKDVVRYIMQEYPEHIMLEDIYLESSISIQSIFEEMCEDSDKRYRLGYVFNSDHPNVGGYHARIRYRGEPDRDYIDSILPQFYRKKSAMITHTG